MACAGGVDWQFLPSDRQLWWKGEIFAELLWRNARIGRDVILPIVPAPTEYGYRARIQLKIRYVKGAIQMGFYRSGSHYVVNIPDHCPLAHSAINKALPEIRHMLQTLPEPDKIPQVDLVTGEDGQTVATVHYIGSRHDELRRVLRDLFPSLVNIHGILVQSRRKNTMESICGSHSLTYGVSAEGEELTLTFSAGGFSQVNYEANRLLVALALEEAATATRQNILDLYCGNGNFSIPLARKCGSVLGVEDNRVSVRDACRNASQHRLYATDFRQGDAVEAVQQLIVQGRRFDLVILDPPRVGGAGLAKLLPELRPATIVYISCDPATLARDLALLQKSGYLVTKTRPVDMFPQTYHMESITVLKPA
ncbi:23S rRNA (uracil(1939)-C(5))-methyltransferase RlmD [Geobacter argillaceus]|nr:23S rRNA (uracil(1939)-C(5))-methyltransferase RlmD [Geobacter argillaceus]